MTTPRRPRKKASTATESAREKPPFRPHHLVPPHELLSEDEGRRILEELSTSPERLPRILVNDPGLRADPKYVTAREAREPLAGRLVRIRRPSPTAGEAVAYRVVVAALGE